MMKKIAVLFFALVASSSVAQANDKTIVGFDALGITSGVTNFYYQMPLEKERALRLQILSNSTSSVFYGFYKVYAPDMKSATRLYFEGGAGTGTTGGFAAALNAGFEMPVGGVVVDPYIGLVTGTGGSAIGYGVNVGFEF